MKLASLNISGAYWSNITYTGINAFQIKLCQYCNKVCNKGLVCLRPKLLCTHSSVQSFLCTFTVINEFSVLCKSFKASFISLYSAKKIRKRRSNHNSSYLVSPPLYSRSGPLVDPSNVPHTQIITVEAIHNKGKRGKRLGYVITQELGWKSD